MAGTVELSSGLNPALAALESASARGMEAIGTAAADHARALAPNWEGLRESVSFVLGEDGLQVGSPLDIAAYAELGTGRLYSPGPEWLHNRAPGGRGRAGQEHWVFFDDRQGRFRVGTPQPPKPFLAPAMTDYREEYAALLARALAGAEEDQ